MTDETDPIVRLKLDVEELTRPRERGLWVAPDKRGLTGVDDPALTKQRSGGFYWPPKNAGDDIAVHLSLLEQLEQLRDGYTPPMQSNGGRRPAGPRPTGGADVADLVVEITAGVSDLHRQALKQLGVKKRTSQPTLAGALTHLTVLVDVLDKPLQEKICRQVHSWVNAARLALSYTAPMTTIAGWVCRYCSQESLITRSDASGDVFCTTPDCKDENGQQPRWPRSTWHLLLTPTEETETA